MNPAQVIQQVHLQGIPGVEARYFRIIAQALGLRVPAGKRYVNLPDLLRSLETYIERNAGQNPATVAASMRAALAAGRINV